MATSDGTDYVIGRPGGPAGPFWSIVRGSNNPKLNGNVIAMQITSEEDAKLFVEALRSRDTLEKLKASGERAMKEARGFA